MKTASGESGHATLAAHRDDLSSASFSPGGTQILTASEDGTAQLWEARPSNVRAPLDKGAGKLTQGALGPDGTKLVTTAEGEFTAKLWDPRTEKLFASLDDRGDVTAAALHAAGTRVVTASADHTAKLWDAKTGKLLASLDHMDVANTAAFTSDSARVVTSSDDRRLWIWNAGNGALIAKLDGSLADHPIRVSQDGTRVITTRLHGAVTIKRVDTGKIIVSRPRTRTMVPCTRLPSAGMASAFSPRASIGQRKCGTRGRASSLLRSKATRICVQHLFSPGGARVATVADDNTAKLWDAAIGKLVASYDGHKDEIRYVGFSPDSDGGRPLTASAGHSAKLWDERTGRLLASFEGHAGDLLDARFSADGTRVMTASRDRTISIWDVLSKGSKPDAIRKIERRAGAGRRRTLER